ncbi:MAG: hypothetical protein Q9169_007185 [Polycauliona sp. 2 TL-2023]
MNVIRREEIPRNTTPMAQQSLADLTLQRLLKKCFLTRTSHSDFNKRIARFQDSAPNPPLAPCRLARAILDASSNGPKIDPRLFLYLEALLDTARINIVDLLAAIAQSHGPSDRVAATLNTTDSLESKVLQLLTKRIAHGGIGNDTDILAFLGALLPWMSQHPGSVTLGLLVSTTLNSPSTQHAMTVLATKKFKSIFSKRLTHLINSLSSTNIQLASALSFYQKQYDLQDGIVADDSMNVLHGVDLAALSFQDTVMDNEPVVTRAGLYIYLNALISDRPMFDDIAVMNYLGVRYKGNLSALVTDLIVAAFDILANAMYRSEPQRAITILRSFLVNKLPVFLGDYAAITFAPLSIETCISQALLRIDPQAFPSLSQMFDFSSKSSIVSEARQEFLFSCALHQLIPEGSIEVLLGDVPMQSLPASGKYIKADLVSDCTINPAKIEGLIKELENMEGNAGEIAGAIFEIITTLCTSNDTMTLKCICTCLVRNAPTLDIIALFCPPQTLLQPLCHILDNWQGDEDQVENQPVYDEFGSVLLLVCTITHRFNLPPSSLDPQSFTSRYFRSASSARPVDQLSEHESNLLGGWIKGLFEAEGINDELMSMCKPAEFHLLVATLFDQSVKAGMSRVLGLETVRGGFEYLLEPFLLPSLLPALTHSATLLSSTPSSSSNNLFDTLVPILQTLLIPASTSTSTSTDSATPTLHSAVLSLIAAPLSSALQHIQTQHKNRKDIAPLLNVLRPHLGGQQADANAYNELQSWARTQSHGLQSALSNSIQALIAWSLASPSTSTNNQTTTPSPPSYTPRLLASSLAITGATTTLNTLINTLVDIATRHGANSAELDAGMDIVVILITSTSTSTSTAPGTGTATETQTGKLSLPSSLRLQIISVDKLSKHNPLRATTLVLLSRRVETILRATANANANNNANPNQQAGSMDMGMNNPDFGESGMNMNMNMAMGEGEGGMGMGMLLHDSQGMPATDIDAVLAHTEGQIASGGFFVPGGY